MSRYLQQIEAQHYGGLSHFQLGPLSPGLNVVYGPNEAGKSTIASLVGGVLFGWEDAHGVRNMYRPANQEGRAGSLSWATTEENSGASVRRLFRDEQGVTGDTALTNDIDRSTYDAVFSLSSEELRQLRTTSDVAARLFTAGAGTSFSPAAAYVQIEQRIAALTAPVTPGGAQEECSSLPQLEAKLEDKREQMRQAADHAALLIQEDRELRELTQNRKNATEHLAQVNEQLEDLIAARAELHAADERLQQCGAERERLQAERDEFAANGNDACQLDERLLALDSAQERVLCDRIDEFAEERGKMERMVDTAKENSATSSAAYEALCELDEEEEADRRRLRNRPVLTGLAVLLPIVFVVAGVPLFVHGRAINSLSITALGVSLVVAALFLAAGAFVALFQRPKGEEVLESRRQDAQWVMLQDRKKLDTCLAERADLQTRITSFLQEAGLGAAGDSLRQAKLLIEEARDARARRSEHNQRTSSLDMRLRALRDEEKQLQETRQRIAHQTGCSPAHLARQLDTLVRQASEQRDGLVQAAADMSQRYGELSRQLDLARDDRSFDAAKLEYQIIRAQLREAKNQLITLLLAKRMLERSIAEWERQGQPEVYAKASELLALITDGRWVQVSTSVTGSLVAVSSDGAQRDPRHLSLGTCQQLYLALRLALLMCARDVGTAIPVLADDIMVHFDAARRCGAARALAQLAQERQVIVFTCHESTVQALKEAAQHVTVHKLSA